MNKRLSIFAFPGLSANPLGPPSRTKKFEARKRGATFLKPRKKKKEKLWM